jgi:hypothetical protein
MALSLLAGALPTAQAGPIPPLPGPLPVAGESDLPSFIFPLASDFTVDWMVVNYGGGLVDAGTGLPIPAGGFLYMYQLENTSTVAADAFSVTMSPLAIGSVTGSGVIVGDDLDAAGAFHPAHAEALFPTDDAVPGPFPGLGGEEGPFPLAALGSLSATEDPVGSNVTWTFAPLVSGRESDTLFFVSTQPPIYGAAVAQDSTPPSPWGSLAPGGDLVPVPAPVPEPSSIVLVGLGALVLASWAVRARQR